MSGNRCDVKRKQLSLEHRQKQTLVRNCPYQFLTSKDGVTSYTSHAIQVQKGLALWIEIKISFW